MNTIKARLIGITALATFLMGSMSVARATTLTLFQTVYNTDFASAGVGGLREVGNGTIKLTGVSGTVTKAYLYWHGHVTETGLDSSAVGTASFNGNPISGQTIGYSSSDGWNFQPFNLVYGQAFRADVTAFVAGNGNYTVSNFSPLATDVQGASLMVFFDDGNPNNNRDIFIYDGDDCNDGTVNDSAGWQLFMHGVNVALGDAVTLQLHVSDGQARYLDDAVTLNNQVMLPAGQNFAGSSPYNTNGTFNFAFFQGSLWDVATYDITSFLVTGRNDIVLTTGLLDDDLSLIAAVANFKTGAGPIPPSPLNNTPPSINIQDPISVDCVPDAGSVQTISATVSDVDGNALSVYWTVNGIAAQSSQVPAGGSTTSATVSLIYPFLQGNNTVTATVSDFFSAPVTIQTAVYANAGDYTAPTVDCGPIVQAVATAGFAPAPSLASQVTASDNCTPAQFLAISQNPPAGTLLPIGTNLITITVTDLSGNSGVCNASFVVNALPPPPITVLSGIVFALSDSGITYRNSALTLGNVLTNDTSLTTGATVSVIAYDGFSKQGGTVAYKSGGLFTYTPAFNFVGTDTFTYTIGDGTGEMAVGTVTVTVLYVNHPPVALPDVGTTIQSTPVIISVLANDSDPDKDLLTVTTVTTPGHGTAVNNGNGAITYTPAANFVGVDTFNYTISDANGGVATTTVTVTVNSSNHAPVAKADAASTAQNMAVTVAVLGNDTDADGDILTITGISTPTRGNASLNSGGTVNYAPAAGFFGVDTFTYTISDGRGGTSTANVVITVVPPPPLAVNDSAVTIINTPVTITVLNNDSDPNQLPLTITGVTPAAHGSPVSTGTSFVYTPAGGFTGTDTFTYTIGNGFGGFSTATVTVLISPANHLPLAANDSGATLLNTAVTISVLSNDSDPDGNALSIASTSQPAHGNAVINGNKTITYTPALNFFGTDTFSYTISDGHGGTATAMVTVTVSAAPLSLGCLGSSGQVGLPFSATLAPTGGVPPYTFAIASGALPPGLTLAPTTGVIKGTPTTVGTYSYTLRVTDFTGVSALSTCASGCDIGAALSFLTPLGVLGSSQTYSIGGLPITAYGYTTGGSPIALYGKNSGANETGLGISGGADNEITSTTFVQLDLTQMIAKGARNATLSIGSVQSGEGYNVYGSHTRGTRGVLLISGALNGTAFPIPSYPAYEFISVSAAGGDVVLGSLGCTLAGGCATTILAAPPVAVNDSATTGVNVPVIISVLANDSDPNHSALKLVKVTQPAHGSVVTNSNGSVIYLPASNFVGTDTFTYTISNTAGGTATATVTVVVLSTPLTLSCVGSSGQIGVAYNAGVTATGGVAPYTYLIASGTLPAGLALNSKTGAIKGTPTSAGTYNYSLKVVDSTGATAISTCASGCGTSATWNFLTPTGLLGVSQAYTVDAVRLTAYGFTTSGSASALYGKNSGGNETGLGISGGSDNEITTRNFVQLDLTQLIANGAKNPTMSIGSVQSGEGYTIYGSHVRGSRGASLLTGSQIGTPFGIPGFPTYEYISVSASSGDVLLGAINATVSGGCSITITACAAAKDVSATCSYNKSVNIPVLSGCSDSQGHSLKVLSITQPAHCTATINWDGSVNCKPVSGYSGSDSFTYTVSDGHGGTCTAKANVTVNKSSYGDGNWGDN